MFDSHKMGYFNDPCVGGTEKPVDDESGKGSLDYIG